MQNISLKDNIISYIKDEISKQINIRNYVVTVVEITVNTVTVNTLTTVDDNPIVKYEEVPIIKTPYFNQPIKVGDIGLLLFASTSIIGRVKRGEIAVKEHTGVLNPYYLPLGNDSINFIQDNNALEMYNQTGTKSIVINENDIIIKDDANSIEMTSTGIVIKDNINTIEMTSGGVAINGTNLEVLP